MAGRRPCRVSAPARNRRAARPTVYGYIALDHDDETEIERLFDQLTDHATAEGLELVEVYVERNTQPDLIIRPALSVLLAAVVRSAGCGVLVPTPAHISPIDSVRKAIETEVELSGGTMMMLAGRDHSESRENRPS
jgi:hypothetical protein